MEEYKHLFEYQNFFQRFAHVKSHLLCGEEKDITPFVTIIIPTYKRPELLKDAIDSAVNQKGFDDYEIVIVDNDPEQSFKTETQLLVESYQNSKIRYYKHDENIGMFANWNRGVELAKGKWVTFLHDDDYFLPNNLNIITSIIYKNKKIQGIKGGQIMFYQTSETNMVQFASKKKLNDDLSFWRLNKIDNLFRNSLQTPTGIFFIRQNVIELGGFNIDFFPTADYLFTTKYLLAYNMFHTNVGLWFCRVFQNESANVSTKIKTIEQNYYIRLAYGKCLEINNKFVRKFVTYLAIRDYENLKIACPDVKSEVVSKLYQNDSEMLLYRIVMKLFSIYQLLKIKKSKIK